MKFWQELHRHGEAVAFIAADGATTSYAQLAADADVFDAVPGQLMLLEIDHSIPSMIAYIGALRRGAPIIVINHGDDGAANRMAETFRPAARWSPIRGLERLAQPGPPLHPELAVMLSTSGTTGATKLVRLSAEAVDANARSIVEYLGIGNDQRAITTLPLGYSYGLSVINSHLAAGASVVLNALSVIDPQFRALVEAHGATSLAGVPYTYELLERGGLLNDLPPSIRTMTQAGGKLAADRVRAIGQMAESAGCRFFVMYGQTEATARMAYLPPERLAEHADCVGRPIPGGHFDLIDPDSGVPTDVTGELVYSGPNVMMGYAEGPDDLVRGPEIERLHTGDLAERVDDLFRIVGRKSRFLKLFGLRLSLEEIEREGADLGWQIIATGTDDLLVVAAEDGSAQAARAHFAEHYGLPAGRIVARDGPIPRLASGKVDYKTIIARAQDQAGSAEAAGGSGGALRTFYQSLSPRAPVSDDASFATLGGDSMSYVQATIVIEAALGHLPDNWEKLTLAELDAQAGKAGSRWTRAVEGEMVARSFAITAIAASHAWFPAGPLGIPLAGGSSILLVIFGYNLFRFRAQTLLSDRPVAVIPPIFQRYILPYYLVMVLFSLKDGFDWRNFALIGVFFSGPSGSLHMYWFFETVIQLTIIIAALFTIPSFRRAVTTRPAAGLGVLFVAAIALRVGVEMVRPSLGIAPRTPDAFLYLAVGGMILAAVPAMAARLAVCALMLAALAWVVGFDSWVIMLAAGLGMLLFLRRVQLPTPLANLVRAIAGSTIYIYLISRFIVAVFDGPLHGHFPLLQVVSTLAAGIALGEGVRLVERRGWIGRFRWRRAV